MAKKTVNANLTISGNTVVLHFFGYSITSITAAVFMKIPSGYRPSHDVIAPVLIKGHSSGNYYLGWIGILASINDEVFVNALTSYGTTSTSTPNVGDQIYGELIWQI